MDLSTSSLSLRPPTIADVADIVRMVQSSRRELEPFVPWATSEYSLADAETWAAGKGYATTAASMLGTFGLTPATEGGAGLARIEIKMSTRNDASRRVAERAGAVFEGTLRKSLLLHDGLHDAHLYSIVEGDR